jgi:hypothetical protein
MKRVLFALACVCIFLVALLLRYKPAYYAAQMLPLPDALEYALSSVSLYQHGVFAMTVNHVPYPSQYPFGFPLLLTPAYALFGAVAQYGLYASLFYSLILVAATMLMAGYLFGRQAALVAGLAAAIGREYILTGQEIMSDAVATSLILFAVYLVLRADHAGVRYRYLFGAGFAAGLVALPSWRRWLWRRFFCCGARWRRPCVRWWRSAWARLSGFCRCCSTSGRRSAAPSRQAIPTGIPCSMTRAESSI